MISNTLIQQKITYLIVGVIVYGADIGAFTIFVALAPDHYILANTLAKIAAAILGYFLHDMYTFAVPKRLSPHARMIRYSGLLLFNSVLAIIVLFLLVSILSLPIFPSKILSDILIIIVAFLISKFIVFK